MKKMSLCIFILSTLAQAIEENLIESFVIEPQKVYFCINKNLKAKYLSDDFFAIYEQDIDLTLLNYSIITMPLVMNIISVIWVSGDTYYIDAMDEDLYACLNTIKEVFRRFYPATSWNGQLIPKKLINNRTSFLSQENSNNILLPFSHGLDSVCSSLKHHETEQLLLTVRGFPDIPLNAAYDQKWKQTVDLVTHFARIHGHKNAFMWSNFHDFYNWNELKKLSPEITQWRLDTVEGLGWLGLAAPILITKGYKTLIIASSYDWWTSHPGAGCPLVENSLCFAGITCQSDLFELPRPERNILIADICNTYHFEKPLTLVCVKDLCPRKNCCKCQKCVISIISFLLAGENPQEYGFDITTSEFLEYVKNEFYNVNNYEARRVNWFIYCQQRTHRKMPQYSPALQNFFTWFNAINFNKLTLPSKKAIIDYRNFTDLFNGIPQSILDASHNQSPSSVLNAISVDFDTAMVCHVSDETEYKKAYTNSPEDKDFFDFNRNQYTTYIQNAKSVPETIRIPKIIHQIWVGPKEMPKHFKRWQQSWLTMHPDWEYRLWTDKEVAQLTMVNQKYYDEEINYGAKSDILRYEILDQFGGVYLDIDFECLKPFDVLHHICDFYGSFFQINYLRSSARLPNGIFACSPGHPLVKYLIEEIKYNRGEYQNLNTYFGILERTGPDYFTKVIKKYVATTPGVNIILPSNYFFSWTGPKTQLQLNIQPETLAIHHYTGSWG